MFNLILYEKTKKPHPWLEVRQYARKTQLRMAPAQLNLGRVGEGVGDY